ncbi:YfaZ family outer membrane protein [Halomonas sp. YLGW01]|uniref:YfaZ family outer membrane protein n=1 Tax=Halomonas sp. YLGW01 TaxID=2773308 RepID=UPI00177CD8EE|nr:YfaZ family outer membrane protein [Halomonas sp. YLGW01]
MKFNISALGGAALLAASLTCQAGNLDLNLNDDAVQFEAAGQVAPGIALGGGFLESDDEFDVEVGHVQLLGTQRNRAYDMGLGARWTQFDTAIGDGGGLGLGGYGYAFLPRIPLLSVGGYAFYTPGVTATQDLDRSTEYGLRARYSFTPSVDGYVGYRRLRGEFDGSDGTTTLDSGANIGVRLNF